MSTAYNNDYLPERKIAHLELVRLRDEFAKAVLPACYEKAIEALENEGFPEENWRVGVALDAYQMADAMLVARNIERQLKMTDRKLLELAAKAAGIPTIPCTCSDTRWPFKHDEEKSGKRGHWNPLEDDGDALRLAVELRLVLHIWDDGELASAAKTMPDGSGPPLEDISLWFSADAHASGGLAAATRRAIVRAAAALGAAQ